MRYTITKIIILILVIVTSFSSCNKNNDNSFSDTNIVGTWQLTETYINLKWEPVQKGYTYTFNKNGTFSTTRFSECTSGNYEISGSTLILKFSCPDFTAGIESPKGTFVENYTFKNGAILLSPTYMDCAEGCENKFKKITTFD